MEKFKAPSEDKKKPGFTLSDKLIIVLALGLTALAAGVLVMLAIDVSMVESPLRLR